MMLTASTFHRVASVGEYRTLVAAAMARLFKAGVRADGALIENPLPMFAYVNHDKWCLDCVCGAGNMVEPAWLFAGCLGCGRVHTAVVMPAVRFDIEALLAVRPDARTRNFDPRVRPFWTPDTLDEIVDENDARGLPTNGLRPVRDRTLRAIDL